MVDIRSGSEAISEAVRQLLDGGVVVLPTETVYGLAARTFDPAAIDRIYQIKGRPRNNPLIAHVVDTTMARSIAGAWPPAAATLADRFWPGPLTMILPRAAHVPPAAAAGLDTLAIRVPSHPVAHAVLQQLGEPVSAPSANRSGLVSPTTATHVADDYRGVDAAGELLVLDGGPCGEGIESTVIDLSTPQPQLLRPGSIGRDQLKSLIGSLDEGSPPKTQVHAPGTSPRHYAPTTPMRVVSDISDALPDRGRVVVIGSGDLHVPPPHTLLAWSTDPQAAASELYALLRQADATDADHIVLVSPPNDGAWDAIHDRIRRASCSG